MRFAAGVLFAAATALAGAALAQESPSEVTDGEIAKYKAGIQKACREPGLARGDPQEKIDSFCNCIVATLDKSITRPEWQQLYYYQQKNREDDEKQVLAPHMKALAVCKGR